MDEQWTPQDPGGPQEPNFPPFSAADQPAGPAGAPNPSQAGNPGPADAPRGWWLPPDPSTAANVHDPAAGGPDVRCQEPYPTPPGAYQPPNWYGPGGPGQGGGGHPGGFWPPPPWQQQVPTPPRRPRGFRPLAAAALVVAIAAAGVGAGHVLWPGTSASTPAASRVGSANPGSSSGGTTNPFSGGTSPFSGGSNPFSGGSQAPPNTGGPSDVNAIAAKVDPALVDINVTMAYQEAAGAGTGIVLTSNGEVLTNNHVVEGATSISVTDLGNGRTYTGTVVGYDRSVDMAVVQLKGASGLRTAELADSSGVTVGDKVVAIGNAGGKGGTPTAAGGMITGLNQSLTASDSLTGSSEKLTGMLATNADVQPGDSGGPLVNTSGRVVGMDTAGSDTYSLSSQGSQGFAIPINKAVSLASQIESGKSSSSVHVGPTAFLGVLVSSSPSGSSSYPGSSYADNPYSGQSGSATGVEVGGVISGTAAAQAGLTGGDTITSFAGQPITSPSVLTKLLTQYKPGQSAQISWTDSSGQTHTATVTLGSGPAQ